MRRPKHVKTPLQVRTPVHYTVPVKEKRKLMDVVALGRQGGLTRAEHLTDQERSAAASKAARARWKAYRKAHSQKPKAKRKREGATR